MRYGDALSAGLPVASGAIEGACRHLVRDRLDCCGARWSVNGAEAVLTLRALASSRDLDDYWDYHLRCALTVTVGGGGQGRAFHLCGGGLWGDLAGIASMDGPTPVVDVYALRWEIELLFRELKSQFKLDDMPSGNKAATECLLYAALLTMAIGRRLLRVLQMRHHSTNEPMRVFPLERWTIVIRSVAPQLLALLLGPPNARLALERRLWIVLQREAPDPNRNRMLLLERAQSGVLQHDLVAA
jgi:hypothetical protein